MSVTVDGMVLTFDDISNTPDSIKNEAIAILTDFLKKIQKDTVVMSAWVQAHAYVDYVRDKFELSIKTESGWGEQDPRVLMRSITQRSFLCAKWGKRGCTYQITFIRDKLQLLRDEITLLKEELKEMRQRMDDIWYHPDMPGGQDQVVKAVESYGK